MLNRDETTQKRVKSQRIFYACQSKGLEAEPVSEYRPYLVGGGLALAPLISLWFRDLVLLRLAWRGSSPRTLVSTRDSVHMLLRLRGWSRAVRSSNSS